MTENAVAVVDVEANPAAGVEPVARKPVRLFAIKILAGPLSCALARVVRVIEKRSTIPILSCIKLQAGDNELRITGTDLDNFAHAALAADIDREGAIMLPAHTLAKAIATFDPDATVEISATKGEVFDVCVISCGKTKIRVHLDREPGDFPALAPPETAKRFSLPIADLLRGLEQTTIAVSTEETRYYLNGILFEGDRKGLQLVATDGHRMVKRRIAGKGKDTAGFKMILKRKAVSELIRALKDALRAHKVKEVPPLVWVDFAPGEAGRYFRFAFATAGGVDFELESKAIDGTFPDHGRVMPSGNDKRAVIDVEEADAALKRLIAIRDERGHAAALRIFDGKATFEIQIPDRGGSVTEELTIDDCAEPIHLGFNMTYMRELLALMSGKTAVIAYGDASGPFQVVDPEDDALTTVLMPMRV